MPSSLLTLYADLAQQVRFAGKGGTVYRRTIGGAAYLYAKVPVGGTRRDLFLGREEDEAVQEQAAAVRREAEAARERRATVRMLRRRGLRGPDAWLGRILDAVADADLFARGIVLVGTGAYQLMEPLVAHHLPEASLMTGDVDLCTADLAIRAEGGESMETVLQRADPSMSGVPELDLRDPPSRFRGKSALVDLLTPILRRTDATPMPLRELKAGAAPLQYLRWLIDEPIDAVALWGAGVAVTIPAPARYAIHKLILAQRRHRTSREKRFKDLHQASALIAALQAADPFAVEDALEEARSRGEEGWVRPIARSLAELELDL
ncbi:MAG TPA: nucleotidyltransferase domain-containing protein [Allosphingosinicella sp.]|jgi:hypothetical protein